MKLLIITSIKECREAVAGILNETAIDVFSVTDIVGFKADSTNNITRSWFGMGGDSYDSIMTFSFTEKDKAEKALRLIKTYNQTQEATFPVRGFVLPVEQYGF